ncbi:MAG TPA: DUF1588 domain-containing protein [Polyangiaceae bacterium]|nr:DUF1588 domain-containing protein [Polyangiaceae bacterium]
MTRPFAAFVTIASVAALGACTGNIGNSGENPGKPGTTVPPGGAGGSGGSGASGDAGPANPGNVGDYIGVGANGMRRLTRVEYDNTVRDLLGDSTRSGFAKLPEDATDPFDNDYKTQQVSGALIEAAETLAQEASARALADSAKRASLVPCTPQGPADATCMRTFISRFGRRALRRTMQEEDVQRYLALQSFAVEAQDFWVGVDLVVRAMLQDPEFLYRIEKGTPVAGKPGVFRLNPFEIATRLSYFVAGSTPSDALLDAAENGGLDALEARRAAAKTLLASPSARDRIDYFHALWLGYHQLPHPAALTSAMRAESAALVERVTANPASDYFELFRSAETRINDLLADHYALPRPGSTTGAWVSYGTNPRRGILSHGSVLSAGAKFDDTSPTLRGVFVRTRLLCETVPPPPPIVNVDKPPAGDGGTCKVDRYASHANVGSCYSCHQLTDPIGFGLEAYDRTGAFRTHDKDAPQCAISGDGELKGTGQFNGPAGLANMLMSSGKLEACVVTQLYRYAMGRREVSADQPTLDFLSSLFRQKARSFEELVLDTVSSAAFTNRTEE